jgi:hypothetical protein
MRWMLTPGRAKFKVKVESPSEMDGLSTFGL